MIFDDVAKVMEANTVRNIERRTGLKRKRIYSLRSGCTFNLDYSLLAALQKMGYDVKLIKVCEKRDT